MKDVKLTYQQTWLMKEILESLIVDLDENFDSDDKYYHCEKLDLVFSQDEMKDIKRLFDLFSSHKLDCVFSPKVKI